MITSAVYSVVRSLRRRRYFSHVLHETLGEAVNWSSFPAVQQIVAKTARAIEASPAEEAQKGLPDLTSDRRACAAVILKHISMDIDDRDKGTEMLAAASRIASLCAGDIAAFRLYLAVFWMVHYRVIMALREAIRSQFIAIHMTCRARAERADRSIESFAPISSDVLTHIKLIGNGTTFAFHPMEHILEVPAGDAYEQCPAKLFLSYQLLVLSCNPACTIKLDDDHRLGDQRCLLALLRKAADTSQAAQFGFLRKGDFPSAHNRGWHIGKCADGAISREPIEMPTPLTFISGEFGYILNRQALWRTAWAALYYRRWLDSIVLEDIAVGEVAEKTWIEKVHCQVGNSISAISTY